VATPTIGDHELDDHEFVGESSNVGRTVSVCVLVCLAAFTHFRRVCVVGAPPRSEEERNCSLHRQSDSFSVSPQKSERCDRGKLFFFFFFLFFFSNFQTSLCRCR
jgi:hypothetical protein